MSKEKVTEVVETVAEKKATSGNEGLDNALGFFKKYQNYFFIGIIAILLGVIAYTFLGKKSNGKKDAQNFAAMQPALEAMSKDSFDIALNGNAETTGLLAIIKKASGTSTEKIARIEAAQCYLKLDKPKEALKMLEDADGFGKQVNGRRLSLMGDAKGDMAITGESINKATAADAISYYEKAASSFPEDNLSANYLFKAAQMNEKIGKLDEAKKLYVKIKDKYPDASMIMREVEKYLGKLGVEN